MARISLVPQKREFFLLYTRAARNAVEIARLLVELLEEFPRGENLLRDIKELEHEGDRISSDLLRCINAQFVTPYDRDDLIQLAFAVDDVADAAAFSAALRRAVPQDPPSVCIAVVPSALPVADATVAIDAVAFAPS